MPDTMLVTGGAGFIGSHLAERLLRDGHRVRIVDNLITGKPETFGHLRRVSAETGSPLAIHPVSITHLDALRPIFEGVDYVLHQAALPSVPRSVADPLEMHDICATGTLNVLIAARDAGVRRVIYASSSATYGDNGHDYQAEDAELRPVSPYGAAKLAGEKYCQAFTYSYGLETVGLRYFNVFGPRQDPHSEYSAVIPIFITRMLNGSAPEIYGDGQQTRDFIYVDNVVHGNLLALRAPAASGQVMNLATGQRTSLIDLVAGINRILGTAHAPILSAPRPGDILHSSARIDRAGHLLGYEPVVDLAEGLARTVDYYREAARP
jgi:UDP-glucose 4-epimerase